MTRCIGALLARNEAGPDRYLRRVLDNAAQFCDGIVVLDDGSTDDTASICRAHPKVVTVESQHSTGWWGGSGEAQPRQRLWELAVHHAGPNGWIYVFDADHELLGIRPTELQTLLRATHVNAWALPLWDCWNSPDLQRVDGYWQAWAHPRAWLYKAQPYDTFVPAWGDRTIHVGHAPANYPLLMGLMPAGAGIRHWSYVNPAHRRKKLKQYLSLTTSSTPLPIEATCPPERSPTPRHLTLAV